MLLQESDIHTLTRHTKKGKQKHLTSIYSLIGGHNSAVFSNNHTQEKLCTLLGLMGSRQFYSKVQWGRRVYTAITENATSNFDILGQRRGRKVLLLAFEAACAGLSHRKIPLTQNL